VEALLGHRDILGGCPLSIRLHTGLDFGITQGVVFRGWDVARGWLVGLVRDDCAQVAALDAQALGFQTVLVKDTRREMVLQPGNQERVVEAMRATGVGILTSNDMESR